MAQEGAVLDGNLETLGLQATLKMLALGGKTGMLSVTSGTEHLQIALQNGQIITLEEPETPLPDLIEVFRLLGRITREDAAQVRQLAGTTPVSAMIFMAQRRLIPPEEIQKRIEFGVVQALSRAVRWERGHFEFHRDITPMHGRADSGRIDSYKPLSVDYVLLEALRVADERDHRSSGSTLSRFAIPRWIPQFQGNVAQLGLDQEDVNVLCLCSGQLPLAAISYGLMLPEQEVSTILQRLLDLRVIEIVDAHLEVELANSLMNLLTTSQYQLQHVGRTSTEQRMLLLITTMIACTNGLLDHHKRYARALRGHGEPNPLEVSYYIEQTFGQQVESVQRNFPRMDGLIQLHDGVVVADGIATLSKVVRGQELFECYRDAMFLLSHIMNLVFDRVIADEAGASRTGRQYEHLWQAFAREIDDEITRLIGRPVGTHP